MLLNPFLAHYLEFRELHEELVHYGRLLIRFCRNSLKSPQLRLQGHWLPGRFRIPIKVAKKVYGSKAILQKFERLVGVHIFYVDARNPGVKLLGGDTEHY